jgi:ATP-binding cassette subfamily F protein 3
VLNDVKLSLQSEQRIGLLGVNGAGKSTLIKTIAGVLPVLSGSAVFNKGLQVGYFAQHQVEMLRDDQSPLWHLQRIAHRVRDQELRSFLGGFNFPGEMAIGSIANFSGGEKARLALAMIVWQRPNLLLLDEPTNHLDLATREALTVALAQFEGTLVLVSHDRHLLRATTDQFLIVANGTLQAFDGDLEDYREWLLKRNIAPKPVPEKKASPRKPKLQNRKPIEARIKRLEELMARLSTRKSEIDAKLGDPKVYQDGEAVKALLHDQAYVAHEIEQVEAEWLAKQAELE